MKNACPTSPAQRPCSPRPNCSHSEPRHTTKRAIEESRKTYLDRFYEELEKIEQEQREEKGHQRKRELIQLQYGNPERQTVIELESSEAIEHQKPSAKVDTAEGQEGRRRKLAPLSKKEFFGEEGETEPDVIRISVRQGHCDFQKISPDTASVRTLYTIETVRVNLDELNLPDAVHSLYEQEVGQHMAFFEALIEALMRELPYNEDRFHANKKWRTRFVNTWDDSDGILSIRGGKTRSHSTISRAGVSDAALAISVLEDGMHALLDGVAKAYRQTLRDIRKRRAEEPSIDGESQ